MATAEVLNKVDLLGPQQEQVNLEADLGKTELVPPPFDPVKLKEKYLAERDKRLQHGGGINQYRLVEERGQFAHYLDDPWVEPGFTRDPVSEQVDAIIIGGGYGAQLIAVRLIEQGVKNIRLIEKAGDFGGTWYWNRYPGAQCDIESYIYMPLLEEIGYMPTEKYARAKELLKHSEMIGRRWGLYERTLFQTETHELRWNEESGLWSVKTNRNDDIKARFVIPAAGPLHRPKLPGVKGIENFKGHSFHSSRWDYKYTGGDNGGGLTGLANKRVAVIGTGATAVQIVPNVSKYAKELFVFQRTPSSIDVRGNRQTDETWAKSLKPGWQKERMDNFNIIVNGGILPVDHVRDGWTDILQKLLARGSAGSETDPEKAAAERQMADFEKMNQVRARCDEIVKDKETAESLKPWYNQLCKRPCFHDEYLQAFNNPNTHLVDTKGLGIERITEKGIIANGKEYEVDCIVYGTGFELATEWSHRTNMEVFGRNNQSITDCWKNGASTLHGWSTRNFPNCFWVSIVQAALTPNFLHVTGEQAKHLAYVIGECEKRKIRTVEPTEAAEREWVATVLEMAKLRAPFLKECTPGYYNNEGTPSATAGRNASYGGGSPAFIKILEDWRAKGELGGLDVKYFED
ncbi:hypothetical protein M409DRAFT_30135 [Zasmidium cellare ATCC 36951]|uniref:FAD/NAD(P)-binding domain-containing protein n=1 Tax=Zasmidium cellare ATCC 36951 TaxID=1080233 RepID=A0A6A6BX20_ZASCE|nr:uncharacterized protein M409DRAFT_30135 [Zasmidium cellare ATCC 36951]KAF2159384.1 hypothetical protein M409DRAFT_30135 [Zasmidium cellare ATCC 36951]